MYYSQIKFYSQSPNLTYKDCEEIWSKRGYAPKKNRKDESQRLWYRKLHHDFALRFVDHHKFGSNLFALVYIKYGTVDADLDGPNSQPLLFIKPDDSYVIINIAKAYYTFDDDKAQGSDGYYGFHRRTDRLSYAIGRRYLDRVYRHDSFVGFEIYKGLVLSNTKDSPSHFIMSNSSSEQNVQVDAYRNHYYYRCNKPYDPFLDSGYGNNDALRHSNLTRVELLSKSLMREYVVHYLAGLYYGSHLLECNVLSHSPYNPRKAPFHIAKDSRSLEDSEYELRVDLNALCDIYKHDGQVIGEIDSGTPDSINPVCNTSMYGVVGRPKETSGQVNGTDKIIFLNPLSRVFGHNIDAHEEKRILHTPDIRNVLGQYYSTYNGIDSDFRNHNRYQPHSYSGGSAYSFGCYQSEAISLFYQHMQQVCTSPKSVLYRDEFRTISMPLSLYTHAVLAKAAQYPDNYEFILNQYFGSDATKWLMERPAATFTHPVLSGFMTEGSTPSKGRNMILDYIKLTTGTATLHRFYNTNEACKAFAIESASGYRVRMSESSYADVIPLYCLDTSHAQLNDYEKLYMKGLYEVHKLMMTLQFTRALRKHISNELYDLGETDPRPAKDSILKYTTLLYDYIKGLALTAGDSVNYKKSIHPAMIQGLCRLRRAGESNSSCHTVDTSLRYNMKENFLRKKFDGDDCISFQEQLKEALV